MQSMHTMSLIFNRFTHKLWCMEKENDSKIEELEKCIDKQGKDIKKLKKKSRKEDDCDEVRRCNI